MAIDLSQFILSANKAGGQRVTPSEQLGLAYKQQAQNAQRSMQAYQQALGQNSLAHHGAGTQAQVDLFESRRSIADRRPVVRDLYRRQATTITNAQHATAPKSYEMTRPTRSTFGRF